MMRLVAIVLLCLSCLSSASAAEPGFDVTHYDVSITPDFTMQTVSGTERIDVTSLTDGLTTLDFSANALVVHASIDGVAMVRDDISGDRRLFHLPVPLKEGQRASLAISFSGKAPKGLAFDGDSVSASYFTCDVIICDQDRTSDRATFSFAVILAPGMEAVAPGRRVALTPTGHGLETWRFRLTQARPAYLFGFAAGRLQRVTMPGDTPQLDVLTAAAPASQVTAMFADTRRMLDFFAEKAGVRFPDAAYTQVLIKGSEAQEAASHSVIGLDEISPILTDPHEDWVIAHELAHQWWGNAITCADWSELWLNEGLTVFMVAAYKEQRWGRADYDREIALATTRWQGARDKGFDVPLSWKGTYPSLKLKRAMAYAKSVVFLDKLRGELGERVFWRAIARYTRGHFNSTVTARDFQRALESESGRNLTPLFRDWVYGTP
jgi:aminopeptidase N